ncbi:MAG TPA: SrtB family sortase [Firmicutes bacterium]|nr:SrtB family sortase [Bacillota bacterium]
MKEFKLKNILIQIHDDLDENQDISELKRINKELKKKFKTKITLVYSKDYLERNYLQQVIFTTVKLCAVIIFTMVLAVLGYIGVNNYQSKVKVNYIIKELENVMNEEPSEEKDKTGVDTDSSMINSYNKIYEINSDMSGWVNVPGTNINYPVVKAKDNSYYLTRNIYKETDYNGWVFMDYRNKGDFSDDNTILYAHNRYSNGLMFGTLTNLRKSRWQDNKNNWNIKFNNLYKEGTWKVFSIYGIEVTSDYLITNFLNPDDKQAFIDMLKSRSEYNFDTNVTVNDKILTLSTCLDTNERFVVHAVLVK